MDKSIVNRDIEKMEQMSSFYKNQRLKTQDVLNYWKELENKEICGLVAEKYGLIYGHTVIEVDGREFLLAYRGVQVKRNITEQGIMVYKSLPGGGFAKSVALVMPYYRFLRSSKVGSHARGRTSYFKNQ